MHTAILHVVLGHITIETGFTCKRTLFSEEDETAFNLSGHFAESYACIPNTVIVGILHVIITVTEIDGKNMGLTWEKSFVFDDCTSLPAT